VTFGVGAVVWLVGCGALAAWLWRRPSSGAVARAGHKFALANKVYVDGRHAATVDAVVGVSRRALAVVFAVGGVAGVIGLQWWTFDQVLAVVGVVLGCAGLAVRQRVEYAVLRGLDACVGHEAGRPPGDLVQLRQRLGLVWVATLVVVGIVFTVSRPVHPYEWAHPEATLVAAWIVLGCCVVLAETGTRRIRSLEFDTEGPAHAYLLDALCHRVVQPSYVGTGFFAVALGQLTFLDSFYVSGWIGYLVIVPLVAPLALCLPGRTLPFRRRLPGLGPAEFVNTRGPAPA
jgi:hypothetical protein